MVGMDIRVVGGLGLHLLVLGLLERLGLGHAESHLLEKVVVRRHIERRRGDLHRIGIRHLRRMKYLRALWLSMRFSQWLGGHGEITVHSHGVVLRVLEIEVGIHDHVGDGSRIGNSFRRSVIIVGGGLWVTSGMGGG